MVLLSTLISEKKEIVQLQLEQKNYFLEVFVFYILKNVFNIKI